MRLGLTTRHYGAKACFGEDSGNLFAVVSLDFNLTILHRATRATALLDLFCELLFFGKANTFEPFDHRHGLAAAACGLAQNINPAAIAWWRSVCGGWGRRAASARLSGTA